MSSLIPYTHLLFRGGRTIAVAGPHILVLDSSGEVESSTDEGGPVRCIDVDLDARHVVTAAEDKRLNVWVIEGGLRLIHQRELPKKPTKVKFTKDGQAILVSDKFGDVFSYPIHCDPDPPQSAEHRSKRDPFASHENPSNGTLILGHASPLNFFVLTDDERHIITADRDEHVRVSRYPNGYIIEMYCLGHLKFVSALHIPYSESDTLISGGGDEELRVWDWKAGRVKWEIRIWHAVERFLVVHATRWREGEEEEEEEQACDRQGDRRGSSKRRRRKAHKRGEGNADDPPQPPLDRVSFESAKVLVVQNIDSISASSGLYVLFSAVGATALFGFPYKPDVHPREIIHFEFEKPVIGFSVVLHENGTEGVVVVSLDGNWKGEGQELKETRLVRVLKITSEQFVEDFEFRSPLIESLNSRALMSGNSSDLPSLDLYGALSSLPKHSSEVEIDEPSTSSQTVPVGAPELSASIYKAKAGAREDGQMSKKELGRLKGKKKVMAKVKEQEQGKQKDKAGSRDEEDPDLKAAKRLRLDVY